MRATRAFVIAATAALAFGAPLSSQQRNALEDAVLDAFAAQLVSPAGCTRVDSIARWESTVFPPSVHFFQAQCESLHGGTDRALVAVDSSGLVYPLDSPTMFRFLAERNGFARLGVADPLRFAYEALLLSGAVPLGSTVVGRECSNVPDEALATLQEQCWNLRPIILSRSEAFTHVYVTISTQRQVIRFSVTSNDRGFVAVTPTMFWQKPVEY
jgi:hypothetical protein